MVCTNITFGGFRQNNTAQPIYAYVDNDGTTKVQFTNGVDYGPMPMDITMVYLKKYAQVIHKQEMI